MTAPLLGLPWLLGAAAAVLLVAYVPGIVIVRLLGGGRLLSWVLAPALAAAGAGIGAIICAWVGITWSLLPFTVVMLAAVGVAWLLARGGLRLPSLETVSPGPLLGAVPHARWWLAGAAAAALGPIAWAFGRADGILERWDTLYHLSALARIRATGDGSSLHLGAISTTQGRMVTYPAAFHDLASLVPMAPVPIVLNAATVVLAVVPWVVGIAVLTRAAFPEITWGPFAAALAALLAPAAPADEWIHLSPIPNLVGFAMLPGVLAAALVAWRSLTGSEPGGDAAVGRGPRCRPNGTRGRTLGRTLGGLLGSVLVLGAAGIGLTLLHPNTAVTALLLIAVLTAATGWRQWRARPLLAAVPLLCLVPVALLTLTPAARMVTGFTGGLVVPWWQGLGELLLGLLTVWPMALGVVLAGLWWPGLVMSWRSGRSWLVLCWAVLGVLYLDAAVDSPLNLSVLFYRGQDRLSMPLTMLTCVLIVPGLRAWADVLGRPEKLADGGAGRRPGATRPLAGMLVLAAVVLVGTSLPTRLEHARMNAALDYPGRGRFLQADELAAFEQALPHMDRDGVILASPFSGASHLYAITGQAVRFPVAGMTVQRRDENLIQAAITAPANPQACRALQSSGIRYVYQEHLPYQHDGHLDRLNTASPELGRVVFQTSHSRLIEVRCASS